MSKSPVETSDDDICQVEAILNHKDINGVSVSIQKIRLYSVILERYIQQKLHYFVKWENYGNEHNSWLPRDHFFDQTLVDEYHANCASNVGKTTSPSLNGKSNMAKVRIHSRCLISRVPMSFECVSFSFRKQIERSASNMTDSSSDSPFVSWFCAFFLFA